MKKLLIINDHEKVENVYEISEEYLTNNNNLLEETANYLRAYYEAHHLVPQTLENFWSGHSFPFSESYYELENSFELCKQGFYRYSLFALRCALELAIIGLCFNKNDRAHIEIQKWIRSEENTPWFKKSLKRIFDLDNFYKFNQEFPLENDIYNLYSLLSDYVHSKGYHYSTTGQSLSNFNQFNESSLIKYVDLMKKTVSYMVTMMLLKYPIGLKNLPLWEKFGFDAPAAGFLSEHTQQIVLNTLDEKTKESLQKIFDSDPIVKEIISQIISMPDLTEEQLNKQRAEWDDLMEKKGTIRQNNFPEHPRDATDRA
jgi:hypothetical protein